MNRNIRNLVGLVLVKWSPNSSKPSVHSQHENAFVRQVTPFSTLVGPFSHLPLFLLPGFFEPMFQREATPKITLVSHVRPDMFR